ncbi:LysM peptidoglycan-binding domain-containing protein [Pontibacter mangrovi]|uniref:LysM peptidoglycan-binding domain-containing protein n=1 Tax=Pontibacter mangrovi TaxID=2589816 RepID=A0A501W4Y3_9BACT|nr:LysM peptidoglycan-binding domain-containing protein [Pontibacter mangrovi]TPE44649.1 LysM peptidoglycan-binding domain-containing protein [Pontibacter mangrovi]
MSFIVRVVLANLILLFVIAFNKAEAAPAAWPKSINITAAAAPTDSVYLVQQGDTYYSLARRFGIPLDSLQNWNGHKLQIGQTLFLTSPNKKAPVAVAKKAAAPAPARKPTPAPKPFPAARPAPERAVAAQKVESTSAFPAPEPKPAAYKTKSRVLVVPFDPHLYFSDADYEIARQSRIPRQNVRYVFRGRLNAMLAPEGYETVHLLGGVYRDSVSELSRLYKSLHYAYADNKQSRYNHQPAAKEEKGNVLSWVKEQKGKLGLQGQPAVLPVAQDPDKHFGVTVKDPEFFSYFNNQYGIDYYVFINQFEVKTIYEHCLDRAAQNYQRDFTVHYSIYDSKGQLVSGNRVKVPFESNINDVNRIVRDSMPAMAERVLADLPNATKN